MSSNRIRSAEILSELQDLAAAVFHLDKQVPDLVTRLPFPDAPFFDGDVVLGGSGWSLVSSLALIHADPTVHFLVVEPSTSEFVDTIGEYGAFSCQSGGDIDCYLAGLFGDGSTSFMQIAYVAETVAIFGASGQWGVWVERDLIGLVVSANPYSLGDWQLDNGMFMDADEAVEFLGAYLEERAPGSPYANTLIRNYGMFRDG